MAVSEAARHARLYDAAECGEDGYPPAWHEHVKHWVREQAGEGHERRQLSTGKWVQVSRCDDRCRHGGPVLFWTAADGWGEYDGPDVTVADQVYAIWRVLTVHHLDGNKANCRWWNLTALCQRCHLQVQGKSASAEEATMENVTTTAAVPGTGADLIAEERLRQRAEEGWTLAHDDAHDAGELAQAAACYGLFAWWQASTAANLTGWSREQCEGYILEHWWPWDERWWKPLDDAARNLAKAGALNAAEIDRLQRVEAQRAADREAERVD